MQQRIDRTDLVVQFVDLRKVVAELLARGGRIHQVAGQREVVGIPKALVAFVPGIVGFGRTDVEEERLARTGHVCQKRFDQLGIDGALLFVREVFERKGFDGSDVPFSFQRDAVACLLEVLRERADTVVEPGVVGVCA